MSRLGKCKHCGHYPIAEDALVCPECGGENPNPSAFKQGCVLIGCLVQIAIAVAIVAIFISIAGSATCKQTKGTTQLTLRQLASSQLVCK